MKKILGLLALLISLQMFAKVTADGVMDDKTVNVELEKGNPTIDDRHPRTLIPITCMYQDGFLCFTFYEDLGELEITVTNQSTGATTTYPYDAASGSVVVGVSNESAPYLIEIETISGDCYWGEYTL